MRKSAIPAVCIALAALMGFGSCSVIFNPDGNIFKNAKLGQFDAATVTLTEASSVQTAVKSSPSFISSLSAADKTTVQKALIGAGYIPATATSAAQVPSISSLSALITSAVEKVTVIANFTLAAVIELKTSPAGAIVDGLLSQVGNLIPQGGAKPNIAAAIGPLLPSSLSSLLRVKALPADLQATPEDFKQIIETFQATSNLFTAVTDNTADGAPPAVAGYSESDVAFYAAVSMVLTTLYVNPADLSYIATADQPAAQNFVNDFKAANAGADPDLIDTLWAAINEVPGAAELLGGTSAIMDVRKKVTDTSATGYHYEIDTTSTLGKLVDKAGLGALITSF